MKIAVVGGGSIGLLVSSYLGEHHEVTVYARRQEQVATIQKNGVLLRKDQDVQKIKIKARPTGNLAFERHDWVIVAVKQTDIREVVDYLATIPPTKILFLQNGMGHVELLAHLEAHQLFLGVVEHGAIRLHDDEVHHTGKGQIKVACLKGDPDELVSFVQTSRTPSFPFEFDDNWEWLLKKKLVVNCAINPLTAIYRVPNGQLIEQPALHQAMRLLFDEVVRVLEVPDEGLWWEHVCSIAERTSENRSSMLKDIENGRKTEIDSMLGFVLQQGRLKGVTLPVANFVYLSILGMEGRT